MKRARITVVNRDLVSCGSMTETRFSANSPEIAHTILPGAIYPMAESIKSEKFEEIVAWAYSTLPEKIKELPDFPGIQVADEPPGEVSKSRKRGTELLGLFSGICRTKRSFSLLQGAPDLIFVFRGPILRCSKGDLRAEVKQVVWHEVAHWLGHDEKEVQELGLTAPSPLIEDVAHHPPESVASNTVLQQRLHDTLDEAGEVKEQQPRCQKCYSADVACRELERLVYSGARLSDPLPVHAKICTCNSCGYEWDDEENI